MAEMHEWENQSKFNAGIDYALFLNKIMEQEDVLQFSGQLHSWYENLRIQDKRIDHRLDDKEREHISKFYEQLNSYTSKKNLTNMEKSKMTEILFGLSKYLKRLMKKYGWLPTKDDVVW